MQLETWVLDGRESQILKLQNPISSCVILFIPGNPGLAKYYRNYLNHLDILLESTANIYCASYPGHALNLDCFLSLQELVHHFNTLLLKLQRIHPGFPVTVAGHSLGSWISLQLLNMHPNENLNYVGLFPTLRDMAKSPQGKTVGNLLVPAIKAPLLFLVKLVFLIFPFHFIIWIASQIMRFEGEILEATLDMVKDERISAVIHLVLQELESIKELDHQSIATIKNNALNMNFYYGSIDEWVPVSHYMDMVEMAPTANAILCKFRIPHAFVINDSKRVAELTFEWFRPRRSACINRIEKSMETPRQRIQKRLKTGRLEVLKNFFGIPLNELVDHESSCWLIVLNISSDAGYVGAQLLDCFVDVEGFVKCEMFLGGCPFSWVQFESPESAKKAYIVPSILIIGNGWNLFLFSRKTFNFDSCWQISSRISTKTT